MPRGDVCRQIALAIRDEVLDLEAAGIAIIQVDEPALREGLPLRQADWPAYLDWAVECFRLATGRRARRHRRSTRICATRSSTTSCRSIAAMDADVISIETTRSRMELLDAFVGGGDAYPAEIGPGIWDIHSPRCPRHAEMVDAAEACRKPADGLADLGQSGLRPEDANLGGGACRRCRIWSPPRGPCGRWTGNGGRSPRGELFVAIRP